MTLTAGAAEFGACVDCSSATYVEAVIDGQTACFMCQGLLCPACAPNHAQGQEHKASVKGAAP